MPFNLPGILVPFHLLLNPRLLVPGVVVKGLLFSLSTFNYLQHCTRQRRYFGADCSRQEDIRQLDFPALYKAGYRGAVFDKDNCLVS